CEAEPVDASLRNLEHELSAAYPALLHLPAAGYLAILKANRRRLVVLTPDLKRRAFETAAIARLIRQPFVSGDGRKRETLLRDAGLRGRVFERCLARMLDDETAHKRWNECWRLQRAPGGPPLPLLRDSGALASGAALVLAHLVQYLLLIASWALLGRFSLAGRTDAVWLAAWALLLFTLLPFQVLGTWLQGMFSIGLGAFLKRRLLYGALKLEPDEVRTAGAGTFLGQALEAEAVERLALSGGLPGLLASLELILAMFLLGKLAWLLACFAGVALYAALRFLRKYQRWTDTRMLLTQDLVESMVGHRTRLAQQPAGAWHESEDQTLHRYLFDSRSLDRAGAILVAALPRCWLVLATLGIAPAIVSREWSAQQTAVQLGGVLLAYTALRKWTGSFAGIAAAWIAAKRIAPLFRAAARPELLGEAPAGTASRHRFDKVLEAERITFRYQPHASPVVRECGLVIRTGDRILLEGPSGGGKTTFASLLSGIRQPESGLLLVNGLDRQTLGSARWRKSVAAAPQFHENHLFTGSLAFNLLMGRHWPATAGDLDEAETVCRELGLGPLLDSMPSGLMQMVGEGGWQLSHGERSRVFVARALLQNADLLMFDESFAALDPETARVAVEYTIQRAPALLVIAHP
ncbi:MAG: ABC transporter ATP-binding protein, partial [Acidobacteriaceae bacterium]|nr:ABC transporter ATP-binding protein [Acidobacteriaceae bacterium]